MSLNFFNPECQEPSITLHLFGLCDDSNGNKAYTDTKDPNKWIATVKNNTGKSVVFTAIDKCIIKDNEYSNKGRCDVMLTTTDSLYLVELKDKKVDGQSDAITQLKDTIELLSKSHDISSFKKRKAFVANKQKKAFRYIDNELSLSFYRKTTFRIDNQAEIVVV